MKKRYAYQKQHVVHDDFGDEVVTINLNSGIYYSLANSGRIIWLLLQNEPTLESIIESINRIYDTNMIEVGLTVLEFLGELIREDLVHTYNDRRPVRESTGGQKPLPDQQLKKKPFSPPVLNIYSDQKELLLLDPIHEVGDLGWPEKKKD